MRLGRVRTLLAGLLLIPGSTSLGARVDPGAAEIIRVDAEQDHVARHSREARLARTPDGWIGYRDRVLTQHRSNGKSFQLLTLPETCSPELPYVVSDGTRTLLSFDGRLLLLTDEGRTTQALYDAGEGPDLLSGMALTPRSEVWSLDPAPDGSAGPRVFRQLGHGETVTELTAATDEEIRGPVRLMRPGRL